MAKNIYKPLDGSRETEKVAAERWQYPDVGLQSESKKGGIGILTAEKIEAIQRQAYQQAYDEGYAEGFQKGREEGKQSLTTVMAQLQSAIQFLQHPLHELDESVVQQVFALVVSITRQLVRREIKTDPGEIVAVIREAISLLPLANNRVSIFLHPEDHALLKDIFSTMSDAEHWRFVDDIGLQRGDCRVSTELSTIDASLETRLMSVVNSVWGGERGHDVTTTNNDASDSSNQQDTRDNNKDAET